MLGTFTNFAKNSSSISKLASFIDQLVALSSCLGTAAVPRDLPCSHSPRASQCIARFGWTKESLVFFLYCLPRLHFAIYV